MDTNITPHTLREFSNSLAQVRNCANRLHAAMIRGWAPGCHPAHEVKLYLEDRGDTTQLSRPAVRDHTSFRVLFVSGTDTGSGFLWYGSEVHVLEHDTGCHTRATPRPLTTSSTSALNYMPKCVLSSSEPAKPDPPALSEVTDLCLTLSKAKRELQLYLNSQQKLHHTEPLIPDNTAQAPPTSQASNRIINLEALLSASYATNDRSKKLPLKPRLILASILASTLLQLNTTPWLGKLWSKHAIYFLVPAAASVNSTVAPQNSNSTVPSTVDLTHPLVSQTFENGTATPNPECQADPRGTILEFGIMLLELWHETTLETHETEAGRSINDEYSARALSALRWLEESENYILPFYYDVIARCIRCLFDGVPLKPTWDSKELCQGIIKGVIEPLHAQCEPSRS